MSFEMNYHLRAVKFIVQLVDIVSGDAEIGVD
jgi:hypothetical protein